MRLLHPWDFSGKSTGMGCHFLLQEIFLTQGSNLGLLHCRQMLLPSEPPGESDTTEIHWGLSLCFDLLFSDHQYLGENKYQKWPVLFSWTVYYYIYQETQCTEWKKNLQDVQFHIKIYVSEYYLQNPRYCLNLRGKMAMKVGFLFSILEKVKTQCRKLKM